MSEYRTLSRQFVEVDDAHISYESASEGKYNLLSQLLDRRMSSS